MSSRALQHIFSRFQLTWIVGVLKRGDGAYEGRTCTNKRENKKKHGSRGQANVIVPKTRDDMVAELERVFAGMQAIEGALRGHVHTLVQPAAATHLRQR